MEKDAQVAEMAKKQVGVMIEEELHLQVKSVAPKRRLNIEAAYEEALSAWLGSDWVSKEEPGTVSVSEENRAIIAFLADLFERKGTPEQEALKASLRLLFGRSKLVKGKTG
jgi:hypothetical protein